MMKELDRIVLTEDLPPEGLKAGDMGTVVFVHKDGEAFEVEFMTLTGETITIATLRSEQVRPIREREIANARSL